MTPSTMKRYILRYLLAVTILVAVVYAGLLNHYLRSGLDSGTRRDLKLHAKLYETAVARNPDAPLPESWLVRSWLGDENLPALYKARFGTRRFKKNRLHIALSGPEEKGNHPPRHDMIFLYAHPMPDGTPLYVVKTYPKEYARLLGRPNLRWLGIAAYAIGGVVIAAFFLLLHHIFRKLYRPVAALSHWAETLPENLASPRPAFQFAEIDQFAGILQDTMTRLSEHVVREERFLNNASHELRTPIAIIQSNVELLERVAPDAPPSEKIPRTRIKRSVTNMNRIVETLLWLARDDIRMPEASPVLIDELVHELVEENRYLLDRKPVTVHENLSPAQLHLVAHPARIAIGNLIRNAFQYTAEGVVEITTSATTVTITNINREGESVDPSGSEYGFGLGLVLVERISERFGWSLHHVPVAGGRQATLTFPA